MHTHTHSNTCANAHMHSHIHLDTHKKKHTHTHACTHTPIHNTHTHAHPSLGFCFFPVRQAHHCGVFNQIACIRPLQYISFTTCSLLIFSVVNESLIQFHLKESALVCCPCQCFPQGDSCPAIIHAWLHPLFQCFLSEVFFSFSWGFLNVSVVEYNALSSCFFYGE